MEGLNDLFKNLEINPNEKMDVEETEVYDEKMDVEETEVYDEKTIITKLINLNKRIEKLKMEKIKIPLDDFSFYMKKVGEINNVIFLHDNNIDEFLQKFLVSLEINSDKNRLRIKKLTDYITKREEDKKQIEEQRLLSESRKNKAREEREEGGSRKKFRRDGRKSKKSKRKKKSKRMKSARRKKSPRKKSRQY